MIDFYGITNILAFITSIVMAILIYIKGSKNKANRIWILESLSIAIYGLGALLATNAPNEYLALKLWKFSYIGIILIPIFFFHFILTFLHIKRPLVIKVVYTLGFILLIFNIFGGSLFPGKATLLFRNQLLFKPAYWIFPPSPLLIFYFFFFYTTLTTFSYIFLARELKVAQGVRRSQVKYFFLSTIISFIGGGTSFSPCFGIELYPVLNIGVPVFQIIMAYAIIKYRLMDIKVAITRATVFIAVYTLVLGLPFAAAIYLKDYLINLIGVQWWMAPLVLMAVLATVGPFIYIYIERKAEDRLLKEQRRYQETLKQASVGMTRIRNLRKLLNLITHIVTKTVRISYASIYLYDKEMDKYMLQVCRDKGRTPILQLNTDNPLVEWLVLKHEPLIYEEVKRHKEEASGGIYYELEESMQHLMASVVIPSFLEDKFIGFIVLGDKVSGQIYTPEDLNVFQVLASQAALAIENAQFYEEAKEMQEQIAQAEKMATVGTMADGLSHQINNRFYALSLIAGDTIDTIKMADTSKCTPEVKQMIDEISRALTRIQTNVMQGGEVVKGILKYTRRSEEKLEPVTIDQIIDGTLEMVQYKVKLSEIDLIRNYPKDITKIKGNLIQLQEAFFNFIDNGYDAIIERRNALKEEGYRGKITISARELNGRMEIVIEDNGMGVQDDNIKKVFTPFFTTKTSSRKGTGLGLYVIKKIITDTHKGTIDFQSQYKIGTRFILTLPLI